MRHTLILMLGLATTRVMSLKPAAVIGRRAAVLAAASSLAPWAANAVNKDDLAGIVQRARSGSLTTTGVIGRALKNDMVDPATLGDCGLLDKVIAIDKQAAGQGTDCRILAEPRASAHAGPLGRACPSSLLACPSPPPAPHIGLSI